MLPAGAPSNSPPARRPEGAIVEPPPKFCLSRRYPSHSRKRLSSFLGGLPSSLAPPPDRHDGPDRLDQAKRPRALHKSVDRAEGAGCGKREDEVWATVLGRIANQHGRDGEQPESGQRLHQRLSRFFCTMPSVWNNVGLSKGHDAASIITMVASPISVSVEVAGRTRARML